MNGNGIHTRSDERFRKAAVLFAQGRYPDAATMLESIIDTGDSEAQNLLGIMYLNGLGVRQQFPQAAKLFAAAAAGGLKEGHYNLSNLLYHGLGVERDEALAQDHLLHSARAGHCPALRALGYVYHQLRDRGPQWAELSTRCFASAANAGDSLSKYVLGLRLQRGDGIEQNLSSAAFWFGSAARDGVYLAPRRLTEIQAGGWVPAQRDGQTVPDALDRAVDLLPWEIPEPRIPIPPTEIAFVSEYRQLLDIYLCDHLINATAHQLAPSAVVDPRTGVAIKSELRTSYSMCFQASMYDAVMAGVVRQIAAVAGMSADRAEPMGVLRYTPGQEYQPHYDYYSDERHDAQRAVTVFVYLNDVEEGGGTEFPRIGVRIQPERGKAVKFLNCDASGQPNPQTLHAGLPVIRGEKWLATLWFWDRPFIWYS